MKKIKNFLMVLSIIGLFVFASCKNNYTPEQAKVACNVEKATIKGVAKIDDAFVPKDTIIQLLANGTKVEDMTVSDDEGYFESTNQYPFHIVGTAYVLKIEKDGKVFNSDVHNFSGRKSIYYFTEKPIMLSSRAVTTIKGTAMMGDKYVEKDTIIQLFKFGTKIGEIVVNDKQGHFESTNRYEIEKDGVYVLKIQKYGTTFCAEVLNSSAVIQTKYFFKREKPKNNN